MQFTKKVLYRAGMIPYVIEDGEVVMMFMKPSDTTYGGDQFQLCKGVIEPGETERQAVLREAHEELGLRESNIDLMMELGTFLGRTTVFIAKMYSKTEFDPPLDEETAEVAWLTCSEFLKIGRPLHYDLVQIAEQVIRKDEGLD